MAEAKQEHSAGGVVYKKFTVNSEQLTVKYLLGKHSGYHKWVLPKGLIEAGETPEQTAVREVLEEMGVRAKIAGGEPVKTIEYEYWAEIKQATSNKEQETRQQPERRVKTYQEDKVFDDVIKKQLVKKRVDFFLMEWESGDPDNHDFEMEAAGWYSYEEAVSRLAFADEREVLATARDKIL
jgi:8-oxo-dGTP pyrophosphatase MutT (NUDIX family)